MNINESASDRPSLPTVDGRQFGPVALRMIVGAQLRRLREARGITLDEASEAIRASHSKISRLELGRIGLRQRDVADLLTLYGVCDETERLRLLDLARQSNTAGWWQEYNDVLGAGVEHYLGLEQAAKIIRTYEAQFIPDLLRTAPYAHAVMRLDHTDVSETRIKRNLSLQRRRQQILYRPEPTKLWTVLDEAALRRRLGGRATMRHQLEHLIKISMLPHVTVQVMPFSAGQAAAGGAITMLRFPDQVLRDVIFLEQLTRAFPLEKEADVVQYLQVMDRLCLQAEPPELTPAILRKILQET
jgi:transcriptional regulator with XRE-family HTH domain